MGKKEFDDFLNEKSKKEETVNWEEKLVRWKSFIDDLYKNIHEWLKEYIDEGKIKIETNEVEIYEEAIGKYSVPSLAIHIGSNIINIRPIGTILIGTIGRVDVIGKSGTQKIILADKKAKGPKIHFFESSNEEERKKNEEKIKAIDNTPVDWEWKLTSNPPSIKYTTLNQESFLDCLMNICNGK